MVLQPQGKFGWECSPTRWRRWNGAKYICTRSFFLLSRPDAGTDMDRLRKTIQLCSRVLACSFSFICKMAELIYKLPLCSSEGRSQIQFEARTHPLLSSFQALQGLQPTSPEATWSTQEYSERNVLKNKGLTSDHKGPYSYLLAAAEILYVNEGSKGCNHDIKMYHSICTRVFLGIYPQKHS